jgi:hypothetical protein
LPEHFFPQIADLIYDGLAARAARQAAGEPGHEPGA